VRLGSPVLEFGLALNADNPTPVIVQPHIALVQVGYLLRIADELGCAWGLDGYL
jgi:hypothetical protein